ncbi:MAG: cyanoexosortase A [Chlorogloeopsis fritschii C42_A2020_084]|uniref:cyanoexosortase A n=1 Tax=Chlorogloeopsis fritschii TaxID=1124 RepID=UPI0019DAC94F|nr:cyanoexosortase A [Chlorogloeopsis fritschii]MBF2008825.1 cyanoexosortase A [Chlorogloeopsis fritschii C42_A2020_084]
MTSKCKTIPFTKVKSPKNTQLWLLGIGAGLIAINLTLTWKSGDVAQVGMSVLFLLAVASLLGDKRHSLDFESGIIPSVLGGLLIGVVLWQSATLRHGDLLEIFLRISPLISGLAVGLLASGFKGLKQYWQELTILFFLGIPKLVLSSLFDISPLTAKFSAFLLWYSGFEVSLQGVFINLPTGSVKVYSACSGIESICYLLGIAVICLLVFPIHRKQRTLVLVMAISLGFIINGIRVSLLAVISAQKNLQAFNYWHEGDGSLIFGMIQVIVFTLFYVFLLRQQEKNNQDSTELKK